MNLQAHENVIASLERHLKYEQGQSVLILDGYDFIFSRSELALIKELWLQGVSLTDIAKTIDRDENEVFLALFHLSMENRSTRKDNIILRPSQIRGNVG